MAKEVIKLIDIEMSFADKTLFHTDKLIGHIGEVIGIVGNNGVGKTTLLNIICGNTKSTKGRIICDVLRKKFDQNWFSNNDYTNLNHSAGEQQRDFLYKMLCTKQGCLLLDEPTNFMDIQTRENLIKTIKSYKNGIIIIASHDRFFLKNVVTKIWDIENKEIREYIGTYEDYEKQKELHLLKQQYEKEEYIREKKHLETIILNNKEQRLRLEKNKNTKPFEKPSRLAATKDKSTAVKRIDRTIKNVEKRLDSLGEINDIPIVQTIHFPEGNFRELHNKYPIRAELLNLYYEDKQLLKNVSFQFANKLKIAITGKNGSGKSTLIKNILENHPNIILSKMIKFSVFKQFHFDVASTKNLINYLQEDSNFSRQDIINLLRDIGIDASLLNVSINKLSGGQRTRIELLKVFIKDANVVILDEPTNSLDMISIRALEVLIKNYPGLVIFVSHDMEFVKNCADEIYTIENKTLKRYK